MAEVNDEDVRFYTSFDSEDAVTNPETLDGVIGEINEGDFVEGVEGQGLKLEVDGASVMYPESSYIGAEATVDFCFLSLATDTNTPRIFLSAHTDSHEVVAIRITPGAEDLIVSFNTPLAGPVRQPAYVARVQRLAYGEDEWHRLTVAWNFNQGVEPSAAKVVVFLDNVDQNAIPMATGARDMPNLVPKTDLIIGDPPDTMANHSPRAVLDELYIVEGYAAPRP